MSHFEDESTDYEGLRGVAEPAVRFRVEVAGGPGVELGPDDPPLVIGSGGHVGFRLADRSVSRRHATLTHAGDRIHVDDHRSTNGTWVSGVATESAFARGGDWIRVGAVTLQVRALGQDAKAPGFRAQFGSVVGQSPAMQRLYPLLDRLAASHVPLLIEGETGTGKEALAESIHATSPRHTGPFVVFDCSSVTPSLFESELFGHERGAFTGAVGTRKGAFELADGGTLLIDEIGDLDLPFQAKLLRAVETATVKRVGGERAIHFDVRIVAATRRDLDREVQEGRFRDDLFHRLAVARIELPPLRRRAGDVALLAEFFWQKLGGDSSPLPAEALSRWVDDPWPGNVRELRNAVARTIALGDLAEPRLASAAGVAQGEPLDAVTHFAEGQADARHRLADARDSLVRTFERAYLERLLVAFGGNLDRVAAVAGVGRRYVNMLRARSKGSLPPRP